MSRVDGDDDGEYFPGSWALWEANTRRALNGKRGKKALAELREALLALPEKRLISCAMSTVGKEDAPDPWGERRELIDEQGEGVCAVGAFVWHKRVKAGEDPDDVMRALPLNPDYDGENYVTVQHGKRAGLSGVLAWALMERNDDVLARLTPEQRYDAFLAWLDENLAATGPS